MVYNDKSLTPYSNIYKQKEMKKYNYRIGRFLASTTSLMEVAQCTIS